MSLMLLVLSIATAHADCERIKKTRPFVENARASENIRLLNAVVEVQQKSGVSGTVEVCEIGPSSLPSFYARSDSSQSHSVWAHQGLVELFNDQELHAVLAHEFGHVRLGNLKRKPKGWDDPIRQEVSADKFAARLYGAEAMHSALVKLVQEFKDSFVPQLYSRSGYALVVPQEELRARLKALASH